MSRRSAIFIAAALAGAAHAPASAGEGASEGLFLLPMDEMIVPIIDGSRAEGRLRLKLVLRAADALSLARLQTSLPQLREASFATASEFARLSASPFRAVDARQLAQELDAALKARDHGISAVLLVEVAAVRA